MPWTMAEGLVDAVDNYMQSNVDAKLAALDAEYADSITLDAPVKFEVSERALKSIQGYPTMFIIVTDTEMRQRQGDNMTAEHELIVGILMLDQDETDLRRKLYRYGRAIFELLVDGEATIGFNLGVRQSESIAFSPLFGNPAGSFIADVRVASRVVLQEAR